MNSYNFFLQDLERMQQEGLYNNIRVLESGQGAYLTIGRKKYLNLCSNNYLGLAGDRRLVHAARKAIDKYGIGTASVRPLSGTNVLHMELEKRLAEFKETESSIVLSSGYMANLAAVGAILDKEDIVVSDELNHASIIDAIRLAGVKNKYIYRHRNIDDLEERLKEVGALRQEKKEDGSERKVLIVTDGVFSMDGDLAPLPAIVALSEKHGAMTMVDDAHGEGVLGKGGRGIAGHFSLHGRVDIEVGTLSKAFGVEGGFIAGRKELIEFYRQKARQFLFSNGLSIPVTAALIEAVKILQKSDRLVKKLWQNAYFIKDGLAKSGFDIGSSESPITPVMLGDENIAKEFSAKLFENGVFATAIKFPMVARGRARIRVMPSAVHTKEDLDSGIKAFRKVGRELGVV